ncbi:Protein CBR-SRT-69 [Caenorhabditis briggsae]|uniref:Protein CBR-SRT-69 n=1 Tax=Caenorhabditis briggsae TaxID=6238 RepID=A8X322_CAEBR|nr:Protein CBR-SRT-69 [Caenorhabditis briggsae]CAP27032.2 Protein CBR-SRT-69 [Caenorhabditis briggsae]
MTYKLMNIINFLQLSQGMIHFITSPALIFSGLLIKFDVILRILGCIMNSCWIADLPVMALLAVYRIFIFRNIIGSKACHTSMKIILSLIFSWILFIILAGCITQNIKLSPPMWGYDMEVPYAALFDTLEIYLSFSCLSISYIAYLIIIFLIFEKRNIHSSVKSRKHEISILLQFTFVTAYVSFLVVIWHPALFSVLSFIDRTNRINQSIVTGLWILHCYVNPVLMLVFNRSIREDVLNFNFRCTNKVQPVVNVSASVLY